MCKAIEDMREECIAIGEAKGKIEGRVEGKEEAIRKMYKNGADVDTISKLLEIDINYINKVLKIA